MAMINAHTVREYLLNTYSLAPNQISMILTKYQNTIISSRASGDDLIVVCEKIATTEGLIKK